MLDWTTTLSLHGLIIQFGLCAVIIAVAGSYLTRIAEKLAIATGLGQAIIGAVAIGIATSLSGTIVSFYTAFENHPALSIGNSLGGIPAQTAFLAIADITYRRANIEHSSASLENLGQSALLFMLVSLPLLAMAGPEVTFWSVHPVSPILVAVYLVGLKIIYKIQTQPMWHPLKTKDTQVESDDGTEHVHETKSRLFVQFLGLAVILGTTGFILAETGMEIASRTPLSQTLIGGLFTSISTSLPELVTTIAAVRRKALNLAVGNIIGGNSFDVLFLVGSDMFYRQGSIYHQMDSDHIAIIATSILMTSFLLMGLLRRERQGPAGIGFESLAILIIYVAMAALLVG